MKMAETVKNEKVPTEKLPAKIMLRNIKDKAYEKAWENKERREPEGR